MAAAGADGRDARVDVAFRPNDRRDEEVRRVEHSGPGRLERGARARDLGKAVEQLKQEPGKGLFVGGVKLPQALAELGLIDEYEFVVHPRVVGHGPTLFAGLSKPLDLKLVGQRELGSGAVAMRYQPRR